jgi:O-methyltransferase
VKRRVVLFDTFAGMTRPTHQDCDRQGLTAEAALIVQPDMCLATLEEVQANVRSFDFKLCEFKSVKGDVCETLLASENIPTLIAVLRLDTDWYESTRLELEVLYPRLRRHGICLIDDYGHWLGARKAVDEFTQNAVPPIYLARTDSTGVEFVKP